MEKNKHYFNPAQQEVMLIAAHTTVVVAGRRTGKTYGIAAPWLLRNMERMARGTIGIVSPSYKMALSNTLPGLLSAWESWGMVRGVHYMVGLKPPDRWFVNRPIIEPASWDNVLSLPNGSIACVVSMDRPGSANGKTFDALLIDEARFIDPDKLKNEIFPANGGTKSYFGNRYYHHSILIISDMPASNKGSWFLDYEQMMDNDLIDLIKGLLYEIASLKNFIDENKSKGIPVTSGQKQRMLELHTDLCRFRKKAVLFRTFSSIENIEVLGVDYIKQMKRDLSPVIFQTSIMTRKPKFLRDGFYSCFSEKNIYRAVQDLSLIRNNSDVSCLVDPDIDLNAPICIGMDFNANISWIVSGQYEANRKIKVIKSYYVTYTNKLRELVRGFCKYNKDHRSKVVIFYYDSTALGRNAGDDTTYYSIVVNELEKCSWSVMDVYIGKPMEHLKKHILINQMMKGQSKHVISINEDNNPELIHAIGITRIIGGKKDKSDEKKTETENNPLKYRTDSTDAFDTLVIGMEKFPQSSMSFGFGGVI